MDLKVWLDESKRSFLVPLNYRKTAQEIVKNHEIENNFVFQTFGQINFQKSNFYKF